MKRLCILGPKNPGFEEDELVKEAKKLFRTTYVKIPDVRIESLERVRLVAGKTVLGRFDAVIPRIPRTYSNYGYALAKLVDKRVFLPNKPESVVIAHHKFLTLLHLDAAGIPIPETFLASTRSAVEDVLDKINYPIVMKLLYGSRGRGVMFAESRSSALALIDTMESIRQPIFIEEYLEKGHEDIRAIVVGGRVVAAMKRSAPKGDKRANIAGGGVGKSTVLNARLKGLAIDTTKALGMGVAGVDIIETESGPKVIEVNYNVNFAGITEATGENIARYITRYVKEQIR